MKKHHILFSLPIILTLSASCRSYVNSPQDKVETTQPAPARSIPLPMTEETTTMPATTNTSDHAQWEGIIEIELWVSAPFSTAKIILTKQGTMSYEASSPRTGIENEVDSSTISQQQFEELAMLIHGNDFWSFEQRYEDETLMDGTTLTVVVKSLPPGEAGAANIHEVSCYEICPKEVTEIIDMIKDLWGKEILEVGV